MPARGKGPANSPVLEIDATRLVVISGQVAVDMDGTVIGGTALWTLREHLRD